MIVKMSVGDAVAELGNDGVTFEIRTNSKELVGRLRLGKASMEWAPKNAKMGAGGKAKKLALTEFISSYLDKL